MNLTLKGTLDKFLPSFWWTARSEYDALRDGWAGRDLVRLA